MIEQCSIGGITEAIFDHIIYDIHKIYFKGDFTGRICSYLTKKNNPEKYLTFKVAKLWKDS